MKPDTLSILMSILAVGACFPMQAEATNVIHVDVDRSGELVQTGESWAEAYASLQDALVDSVSGDEIWVAEGIYYPDVAEMGLAEVTADSALSAFFLKDGVAIYGGFDAAEGTRSERDHEANVTILSGDLEQDDVSVNGIVETSPHTNINGTNSLRVIVGVKNLSAILDGFTITAGSGGDAGAIIAGGTFRRCVMQGNYGSYAGVIYQEGELFTMIECDLINNTGRSVGAVSAEGLIDVELVSCRIQGNQTYLPNGSSSLSVGGVDLGGGSGSLVNCLISGNVGDNYGGVSIRNKGSYSIQNTTIAGNWATSADDSGYEAGGVGIDSGPTILMANTLIWGNSGGSGVDSASGSFKAYECLIEGHVLNSSNLDGTDPANEPLFLSPVAATSAPSSSGDYRLPGHSPAVDGGDAIENPGDGSDLDEDGVTNEILPWDLVGTDREIDDNDIGAYEYDGPGVINLISTGISVEEGTTMGSFLIDFEEVFDRDDLSYELLSMSPTGVVAFPFSGDPYIEAIAGDSAVAGDSTVLSFRATDTNGDQIEFSFTVTIVEPYRPGDNLVASLGSWFTERSSRFARIYRENSDIPDNSMTTWDGVDLPVFAGPQEISYTDNFVYVKTAMMSAHVMGPWYLSESRLFENLPGNQAAIYCFPRVAEIPDTKAAFPPGVIGLMVDGSAFFSSWDTYAWDNAEDGTGNGNGTGPVANAGNGDGIWNHDARVTEGFTFDPSNSHSAGDQFHYHASPTGLRHLLGDNVDYDESTNTYDEVLDTDPGFNGRHSPIMGWMNDGLPLYGPYGFSDPSDAGSGVRRMRSGFILRDGDNGTYDVNSNGRDRLPDWSVGVQGIGPALTIDQQGPETSGDYFLGYFMEDYAFKGDVGFDLYQGGATFDDTRHYDLNEYNVRFCVTPEFPEGTWAYFTNIDALGDLAFPYNVAQQFFGNPEFAGSIAEVPADDGPQVIEFTGGLAKEERSLGVDPTFGVVITWSAVEGGTYEIQKSEDLDEWSPVDSKVAETDSIFHGDMPGSGVSQRFYRAGRITDPSYDDTAFGSLVEGGGGGGGGGGSGATIEGIASVTPNGGNGNLAATIVFDGAVMLPPAEIAPDSVTIGSVTATGVVRDGASGDISANFNLTGLAVGTYTVTVNFTTPDGNLAVTGTNLFSVTDPGGGHVGPATLEGVTPNNGNGGPPGSAPTVNVSFTVDGGIYPESSITAVTIDTPMPIVGVALVTGVGSYSADFTLQAPPGTYDITATFADGSSVTGTLVFTINGGGPP